MVHYPGDMVSAAQIAGKENLIADFESRRNEKASEWTLNINFLKRSLNELQFSPTIDIFATRINKQFDEYISYRPDDRPT